MAASRFSAEEIGARPAQLGDDSLGRLELRLAPEHLREPLREVELVHRAAQASELDALDAETLAPIADGVQADAFTVDGTFVSLAAGLTFDAAGRLYVGHTGGTPIVTAYRVIAAAPPPVVTCVGTPESPAGTTMNEESVKQILASLGEKADREGIGRLTEAEQSAPGDRRIYRPASERFSRVTPPGPALLVRVTYPVSRSRG
jgi:hypothetical protein